MTRSRPLALLTAVALLGSTVFFAGGTRPAQAQTPPQPAGPGAGDLDASFGTGGRVTTSLSSGLDQANAVAVQPDGKVVAVGTSGNDFAVVRYNADGSLDTTFSSDGKVSTDIGSTTEDRAFAVALQRDGKIVVAGTTVVSSAASSFAVVRYTKTGALDSTFGTAGKVTTAVTTKFDEARAVEVQYDSSGDVDKIVVAGHADDDFAVVRYTPTGGLDQAASGGFGALSSGSRSGFVTTDIGDTEYVAAVAVDSNNNIVVAGTTGAIGGDAVLVRYDSLGRLSGSFGGDYNNDDTLDGYVTTDIDNEGVNALRAMALQPDGKIVVAGDTEPGSTGIDFAVLRYTSAGALDTTFGTGGKVITPVSADGAHDRPRGLAVQSDGKIVVAGGTTSTAVGATSDFAVVRYNTDGSLDAGFGTGGKATAAVTTGNDYGYAMAIARDGLLVDGKIIVVGVTAVSVTNNNFAVASFLAHDPPPAVPAATTLVSNLAQTGSSTFGHAAASGSQSFTTGANSAGYVLSGIEVDVGTALNATAAAKVRAELWSSNADGSPGAFLEKLGVPDTLSAGANTLTAPQGTVLAPETAYHVVVYTASSQALALKYARANAEDSGAAAGFTIADAAHRLAAANPHSRGGVAWGADSSGDSYKIAVKGAARPEGTGRPIWSAQLTPADFNNGSWGCFGAGGGATNCDTRAVLSNNAFVYKGVEHTVSQLTHANSDAVSSRSLSLRVTPVAVDVAAFNKLTLRVDGHSFAVADLAARYTDHERVDNYSWAEWLSTGMVWSASDEIRVVLTVPVESSNNDLSALALSSSTSSTGSFSAVSLSPAFDASAPHITSYSATVGNEVTHAKLTATVDDTGKASMVAGKIGASVSTLADGGTSGPIALDVGDNELLVRVTAESGETKEYTVTVRRQSANADLSGLVLTGATSETGTFRARTLTPAFSAGTTSYSAEVGSSVSHVKLAPTAAEPGTGDDPKATVQVRKAGGSWASVASGSPSAALALSVGSNSLEVRVTAEDTSFTKPYTVTVTRRSPSADLEALSVSVATSETGTYSARMLTPAFAAGTTSYSVSAARDVTHAKITATALETGATLQVGKPGSLVSLTGGDESAAIALERGANPIQVAVSVTVAGTTRTKTYTVSVNVAAKPTAPRGLAVAAAPHGLDVSWTPPVVLGVHAHDVAYGYDVAYTSMSAADLADGAEAGGSRNPASGWVDIGHDHRDPKAGIGGLTPGQNYRVRVRGYNSFGTGPWAVVSGTPIQARRTVVLSASPVRVREGDPVTVTATVMHDGRPTAIQENLDVLLSTHLGTAEAGDMGTTGRVTIAEHTTSGSVTIPTFRDGDGDDETFAVLIRWIPKQDFARPGDPRIVWVTITENDTAPPEPAVFVPELRASGGDEVLHLGWDRTAATQIAGYDVHYKRSNAPDAPASGGDAATGWVGAGHSGTDPSLTISGLVNWVDYDTRVRLVFADGTGRWSDVVSAHPAAPVDLGDPTAVSVAVSHTAAAEGDTVTVTATLNEPAPRQGAVVRFWAYGNTLGGTVAKAQAGGDYEWDPRDPGTTATRSVRVCDAVRCQNVDRTVTAADDNASAPIRIAPGATTATAKLVMRRNAPGSEPDEGIAVHATVDVADPGHQHGRRHLRSGKVTLTACEASCTAERTVGGQHNSPPEQQAAAPQPTSVALTLDTARVGETAGAVTVTATLDAPAPEGGIGGFLTATADSTATENTDFSMPVSVFIPGGQTAATATVTVIDDDIDETDETVVISALFDLGTAVLEHTVTLTITDDDTAAITVTPPQTTLTGIATRYDTNGDGAIDGTEYQKAKTDWLTGQITYAQFLELVRIHLKPR